MSTLYDDGIIRLIHGDVIERLRELDDNSIDAIVTDPPYGLEFMGKEWDGADGFRRSLNPEDVGRDDVFGRTSATSPEYRATPDYQLWCLRWAAECLRVLKPGGHLLAFGGTRTYHRLTTAIEDAGFEIRDCLVWGYASGFPKSLNVAKAGAGDDWAGWGTALKPAWEPIVMARKPIKGTVAANVLEYGTGALNIDAARIPTDGESLDGGRIASSHEGWDRPYHHDPVARAAHIKAGAEKVAKAEQLGRWPANVMLTDPIFDGDYPEEVAGGGQSTSLGHFPSDRGPSGMFSGDGGGLEGDHPDERHLEPGGKSRFFLVPKADRAERERGLQGEAKPVLWSSGTKNPGSFQSPNTDRTRINNHPTVKPLDLMVHLVRLVTPPGGTVLDPFVGSGTTMLAASQEGYKGIGVDQSEDYLRIAEGRLMATPIGLGLIA